MMRRKRRRVKTQDENKPRKKEKQKEKGKLVNDNLDNNFSSTSKSEPFLSYH